MKFMFVDNNLRGCRQYTGFASGWGVERVLMMKDGIKIDDLRTLYSNDLDFLKQFYRYCRIR